MNRMKRSEWLKTPYAGSDAKNPDAAIIALLKKYKVEAHQITQGTGKGGLSAICLRFQLKDKSYRITLETLCADASRDELVVQIKRAIFFYLKSILEIGGIFFTVEEALFAFLELPGGTTTYQAALPNMDRLLPADFGRLLLPAPKST